MGRQYKGRSYRTISCIDCGVDVSTNSNKTLRCRLCAKSAEFRNNMLKVDWRLGKLLAGAQFRATAKNLPFDLKLEYLLELWDKSNGTCSISGRKFDLTSSGTKGQVNPDAPSIDRIIPKLEYVTGNIRIITYHTNVSLSEFGYDNLILLCKDVLTTHANSI